MKEGRSEVWNSPYLYRKNGPIKKSEGGGEREEDVRQAAII